MLCSLPFLAGCHPGGTPFVVLAGVEAASIAVFHRDGFDLGYSMVTGRDCSIVRLDRGERYCRQPEPAPAPPVFCARSLGVVDCYDHPELLTDRQAGVADAPGLNAAQEHDRTARWPDL